MHVQVGFCFFCCFAFIIGLPREEDIETVPASFRRAVDQSYSNLETVNSWFTNIVKTLVACSSVMETLQALEAALELEYPSLSSTEIQTIDWSQPGKHLDIRARSHLLGMTVDAMSDALQDFVSGVAEDMCLSSFKQRLRSGPAVFARMLHKGMGQTLDYSLFFALTRPGKHVAVSHVWGRAGKLVAGNEASRLLSRR